jgi:cation diffusion facilitator family transporter
VVRGALWIAQRDADEDHPYGHTKAESIAGLTVALVVAFSAGVLGLETVRSLGLTGNVSSLEAGGLALVVAIIKESLYHYTRWTASKLHSAALTAAAWDHRSDALCSLAIAVALWAAPWLGTWGWAVDPAAALVVCAVLIVTGLRVYSRTAAELMDQQADAETVAAIALVARKNEEIADIEKLRVRKSGLEFFVEIHVQVEGHLTVSEGHRLGHWVKDAIIAAFPRVRDVHVHVEPYAGDCT